MPSFGGGLFRPEWEPAPRRPHSQNVALWRRAAFRQARIAALDSGRDFAADINQGLHLLNPNSVLKPAIILAPSQKTRGLRQRAIGHIG
jgi:hypothetical protein